MNSESKPPGAAEAGETQDLPAGNFSAWLRDIRSAQVDRGTAGVPCGECIGCCTSSYFIHIGPGESATLRRIPPELLFPAPGLPRGHVLLGYDEQGRCPMLVEGKCSVYEDRPQTCRSYDCRVFPATGLEAGESCKDLINQRTRRWRFRYPAEGDRREHLAVQAAATFLREHADWFPEAFVPRTLAQMAMLAIKVYEVFLNEPETRGKPGRGIADREVTTANREVAAADREISAADRGLAAAIVEKLAEFDARRPGPPPPGQLTSPR